MEDMKTNQQVFAKIVEKLEELRAVVKDDTAVERLSKEVTGALNSLSDSDLKSNEALAENLRSALMPLVEAVVASNDVHKTLAASVESSNRNIESSHSQLLDELMGKIDLINNPEMRPLAISEEASGPSLESIPEPSRVPSLTGNSVGSQS